VRDEEEIVRAVRALAMLVVVVVVVNISCAARGEDVRRA